MGHIMPYNMASLIAQNIHRYAIDLGENKRALREAA